jgi:dihydrofolate reductase
MEAILALDTNNGLSKEGIIPWNNKKDLNFFYKKTKNHVVIMGKNTYFSLPDNIRPLKNRLNIVLTRQPNFFLNEPFEQYKQNIKKDVIFTNNMNIHSAILNNREKFCTFYPSLSKNFKIFIIGGKQIYDQYIPLCNSVWVTRVKKCYSCDLTFEIDLEKEFKEVDKNEDDEICISKYIHL